MRVKNTNKDVWGKLKRVLQYLNGTKYLKLCISVDELGILKWYMDRSHNINWDSCKGHAGAIFTLGQGAIMSYLRKVKLDTQSSTKTELVGVDMYMPEMLWSCTSYRARGTMWRLFSFIKTTREYTTTDEEWAILKRKEDNTYQGEVFLRKGQD